MSTSDIYFSILNDGHNEAIESLRDMKYNTSESKSILSVGA